MAENLGVVSSAFAVVSLTLQILDTVQQLHTIWQSFENPGSDVERIKDYLARLHAIAASIAEAFTGTIAITAFSSRVEFSDFSRS